MNTSQIPAFHLAFPVNDLELARQFYGQTLGCKEGRSAQDWVDFNFYGHQIVAHLAPDESPYKAKTPFDGKEIPVRHFGIVLPMEDWKLLAQRLQNSDITFLIEPHIRLKGQTGEQATMFFHDPSDNAIEIKGFNDLSQLFSK